jgi:SAM-dependent methyltransferase
MDLCDGQELILKRDPRLGPLLKAFDTDDGQDATFLDMINRLIEGEAERLYGQLFARCSLEHGKTVSKAERTQKGLATHKSLIYGEVEFPSFAKVLRKISPAAGGTFYDLGSGTGKAVFVARFLHDFARCKGVELLQGLHEAAAEVLSRYEKGAYRQFLAVSSPGDVGLELGSILDCDWSDGDVVFANSTCFDDDLMDAISKKAAALKPGAFVVTFTKGLTSPHFEVMERKRYKMSWGPATVYIHRRLNPDGTAFSVEPLKDVPDDDSYTSPADDDSDDDSGSGDSGEGEDADAGDDADTDDGAALEDLD